MTLNAKFKKRQRTEKARQTRQIKQFASDMAFDQNHGVRQVSIKQYFCVVPKIWD